MATTFALSKDKKQLVITTDLNESPFEPSGSGRTLMVAGGGAPMKTGIKLKDNAGKDTELTCGLNVYMKNPDFKKEEGSK